MTKVLDLREALESLEPRGPLALPTAVALDAPMQTWAKTLHAESDGSLTSGFWKCEPGRSRWDFHDRSEMIYVLDGVMHVQEDGGSVVTLTAGKSAAFPKGWSGIWTIDSTIVKFFVITR